MSEKELLKKLAPQRSPSFLWWVGLAEYPEDSGFHPIAAPTAEEAMRIARQRDLFGDAPGDEPQELDVYPIVETDIEAMQDTVTRLMERVGSAQRALNGEGEGFDPLPVVFPQPPEPAPSARKEGQGDG